MKLHYNVQVLNGLPEGWGAEVVASLDDQFGIIKISSVTRDRELAPGGVSAKTRRERRELHLLHVPH